MKRDEHICTMAIRGTDGTTVIGPDAKVSSKGYKEGIKYIHVRGGQGNVGKAFMDYYQDYVRPRHLIRGLKQGQGSLSYQKGRNHFGNVCKQWYYTGQASAAPSPRWPSCTRATGPGTMGRGPCTRSARCRSRNTT